MSEIQINNNPKPPKRGDRVMAKDIAELWQSIKRLAGQYETIRFPALPNQKPSPLVVTLRRVAASPVTWRVFVQYGHVIPRHNASGDTGAPLTISSLPTEASPQTVADGDKLQVKLTIDGAGKVTTAAWEKVSSWTADTPPILKGGGSTAGTAGTRFVRIAEILSNPDSTTTPAQLMCNQLHTGHIDHFQPTIVENTVTSVSTGEARVLKEFVAADGLYECRYIAAGVGMSVTENADSIGVAVTGGNLNLTMEDVSLTTSGDGYLQYDDTTTTAVLYFRNGLFVGTTDPGGSPSGLVEAVAHQVLVTA